MERPKSVGRWVGFALLFAFFIGIGSNFKLQSALFDGGGFMVNAGAMPSKVGLIVLFGLLSGLLSLWVAVAIHQQFKFKYPILTLFYLCLVIVSTASNMLENTTIFAMRSLSESYLAAGPDAANQFDTAKTLLRGLRNGVHFPDKLLGGVNVLLFFTILFKARAIPRVLSVAGLIAALSQMLTVAMPLFGREVNYYLLAPLALVFLTTSLWLLVKGFTPTLETSNTRP